MVFQERDVDFIDVEVMETQVVAITIETEFCMCYAALLELTRSC